MEYLIVSNVAEKTPLFIEDEMTVGEVRAIIGVMLDVAEGMELLMTYNGKQLRNDAEEWGIVVPRPTTQPSPVRKLYCNVTGRPKLENGSAEALRAVIPGKESTLEEERADRARARAMEPMIDAMASNPQMMSAMLASQPGMKKMMEENPELARQMKDPEMLKTMMMSQLDPDRRKEMGRNMELALSQISNYPGGQQLFDRYMTGFLRDQENMTERTEDDLHSTSEELARPDPTKERNSSALPNPWERPPPQLQQHLHRNSSSSSGSPRAGAGGMTGFGCNPFMMGNLANGGGAASASAQAATNPLALFGNLDNTNTSTSSGTTAGSGAPAMDPALVQQMMRMRMGTQPSAPAPAAAPAETEEGEEDKAYTEELAMLRSMGFEDEALCKEALKVCHGDVEAAVDYIAEKME